MIEAVKNFIKENNLENVNILIGLSGGIDSAVLFDILTKLNLKLKVIHLNHNWRGGNSKKDEEFVKKLAHSKNIEFYSETLSSKIKKTETCAREARYDFFARCQKKFNAGAVFLAHNKNDNAETLIYRLIKGTGPSGLNSIPKIRGFYYRPLLDFERAQIEEYAKKNNIEYVVDKSNFDTKYKRNLIREKIIPSMKEINKEVIKSISNFIELNKMNQKIMDSVLFEVQNKIVSNNKILKDEFLKLDNSIQYEFINRFLKEKLKNRDYKTISKIVEFIKNNNSSKISINNELFLKVYDNKIYLVSKDFFAADFETILKEGENLFLGYKILIEKVPCANNVSELCYVNLDFKNKYILRTRRKGDKFQPFGSKLQKLKDYLINKKIPLEERDKIPLIALDNEIVYIFNRAKSEKLRIQKNESCYKISLKKEEKWS